MHREFFGKDQSGKDIELFIFTNTNGTQVKITTLGAAITSFIFKDTNGIMRDVVLGYDKAEDYIKNPCYFGVIVGRCVNRISNAKVTINDIEYPLEVTEGTWNSHSGSNGVSRRNWEVESIDEEKNRITLKIFSAHLEQGFPGNMTMKVTYTLTEDDAICIDYEAVSDMDTIANLTNHSYFNLAGHDSGETGSQQLKLYAKAYTPVDSDTIIPTGEIRSVEDTPFDFTEFKALDRDLEVPDEQIICAGGYNHNFVNDNKDKFGLIAEARCEETGIHLYAYTDCPGVQLYAGRYIEEQKGKAGVIYGAYHGFCLETQYFPDAVNRPEFKSPVLKGGEVYSSSTVYRLALECTCGEEK
ncbi:MAG: galactose mutarotase [Lachnospiraceae bacterium]|nr:galactose mutarotase [Lachnospiraceae bacterium]